MTAGVSIQAVRSSLRELADADYQARVWTGRGAGDEMSSFVECVARLYDDSGLEHALDRGQIVFSSNIDDDLRALGSLVAKIDSAQAPDELVADPRMRRVREKAAAILREL